MIQLTEKELRKLQMIELEMLLEVDRICKTRGIRYNIIAGTLLGAVRHRGFIPWDDDADVAFLRPEYEKFREACKTELDTARFEFQDNKTTAGYRWGYGKLRRKDTLFLREHQEGMPYFQGVFIDLFPLDAVPDNYLARSFYNFECFCVRKTLWSEVGKKADKNPLCRVGYSLLSCIPEKWVFRHLDKMIERSARRGGRMVRILTFPTPNSAYGYLRRWYEKSAVFEFEGRSFYGISEYDSYLSFKFGDYMELPRPEDRKTHPVSALKLTGKEIWNGQTAVSGDPDI